MIHLLFLFILWCVAMLIIGVMLTFLAWRIAKRKN